MMSDVAKAPARSRRAFRRMCPAPPAYGVSQRPAALVSAKPLFYETRSTHTGRCMSMRKQPHPGGPELSRARRPCERANASSSQTVPCEVIMDSV